MLLKRGLFSQGVVGPRFLTEGLEGLLEGCVEGLGFWVFRVEDESCSLPRRFWGVGVLGGLGGWGGGLAWDPLRMEVGLPLV